MPLKCGEYDVGAEFELSQGRRRSSPWTGSRRYPAERLLQGRGGVGVHRHGRLLAALSTAIPLPRALARNRGDADEAADEVHRSPRPVWLSTLDAHELVSAPWSGVTTPRPAPTAWRATRARSPSAPSGTSRP